MLNHEAGHEALTRLTRLARHRSHTSRWLRRAVGEELERNADTTFRVARETGDPIGHMVAEQLRISTSPATVDFFLTRCEEAGDALAPGMWEVALVATQRTLERLEAAWSQPDRHQRARLALLTQQMGGWLADLGNSEEALQATDEAVRRFRQLVEEQPGVFEEGLAGSLNFFGESLLETGQYDRAVICLQECVDLYHDLISKKHSVSKEQSLYAERATCLSNLGIALFSFGRERGAVKAFEDSLAIHRQLVAAGSRNWGDVAGSVSNLAWAYREVHEYKASLEAAIEAVDLYRQLSQEDSLSHRHDLAMALDNLSATLGMWLPRLDGPPDSQLS